MHGLRSWAAPACGARGCVVPNTVLLLLVYLAYLALGTGVFWALEGPAAQDSSRSFQRDKWELLRNYTCLDGPALDSLIRVRGERGSAGGGERAGRGNANAGSFIQRRGGGDEPRHRGGAGQEGVTRLETGKRKHPNSGTRTAGGALLRVNSPQTDTIGSMETGFSGVLKVEGLAPAVLGSDGRGPVERKSLGANMQIGGEDGRGRCFVFEEDQDQDIVRAYRNGASLLGNTTSMGRWELVGSFFFSVSTITTIGYGNLSPHTMPARLFCIFFALVGIPLNLVVLNRLGHLMQRGVHSCARRLGGTWQDPAKAKWLAGSGALLSGLLLFLLLPPLLFSLMEGWTYLEGFYFAFITLSTVGFGDYVIGMKPSRKYPLWYKNTVSLWILFGMAWLALIIKDPDTEKRKSAPRSPGPGPSLMSSPMRTVRLQAGEATPEDLTQWKLGDSSVRDNSFAEILQP
ncbi:Potassium channel subfamily K member 17 [Tupaia chinensis]|uniref:Potassium channel subfamily K member 17 n=1 Tax=Tupaia chinensis TaxID=246437 RepID=M0QT56_TUPCH|nr:Potassium channel subfamily K member 17 [Tupaia chinensis]